ncbi:MAG: hypothetical protein KJT03_23800, partial [Verrucomicrobiae bacterium]|nr:hypothetical protein [Verrucomicrobiae bacterium]
IAWDSVLFENEGSDVLGKTIFRGSFEHGDMYSNPPDVVPPTDRFSSWWEGIGSQDYLNRLLQIPGVTIAEIPNSAVTTQQVLTAINAGLVEVPEGSTAEEFAAVEGQFVPQTTIRRHERGRGLPTDGGRNAVQSYTPYFLFPAINFNSITSTEPGWNAPALNGIQGIMGRWRPASGTKDVSWSQAATAGAGFRQKSMTNRNIFDYHKNLLQGTTNYIDTSFDIKQFVLEQEILDGRVGVEVAWDKQSRDRVRFTPFSGGDNKAISLDLDEYLAPGDPDDDGVADPALANENLGRPVLDWDANNTTTEANEQETFRATLFGTLDFRDLIEGSLGKILGSHTLTGLYEDRTNESYSKNVRGSWWADSSKWPGDGDISNGLSDNFRRIVKSRTYLGDS